MVHHSQAVASEVDHRLEKHIVTDANLQKQLESTECALQKARAELAATTALQAQDAPIVRERAVISQHSSSKATSVNNRIGNCTGHAWPANHTHASSIS